MKLYVLYERGQVEISLFWINLALSLLRTYKIIYRLNVPLLEKFKKKYILF